MSVDVIGSLFPDCARILILGDGGACGASDGAKVTRRPLPLPGAAGQVAPARFDLVIIDPLELPLGRSGRVLDYADRVLDDAGSVVALAAANHVSGLVAAFIERGYAAVSVHPEGNALILAQRCERGTAPRRCEELLLESQIALAERDDLLARLTAIRGHGGKLGPMLARARASRSGRLAWRTLRRGYRTYRRLRGRS